MSLSNNNRDLLSNRRTVLLSLITTAHTFTKFLKSIVLYASKNCTRTSSLVICTVDITEVQVLRPNTYQTKLKWRKASPCCTWYACHQQGLYHGPIVVNLMNIIVLGHLKNSNSKLKLNTTRTYGMYFLCQQ